MTTETAYVVNIITGRLQSPWGLTQLPDGRLLVTQKQGNLVIVDIESESVSEPIEGIESVNSNGQGGLLDIALDPDYESSRMLYLTFSEDIEGGTVTSVVRGQLSEDETSLENVEVIFRAEPAYQGEQHYGSRLVFDADGNLFVTTGERSDSQVRDQAQSMDSYLGKVLHITPDGEAVADSAIYTLGHRNVQGIAMDPTTGDIWISEMGPRGGDELNLLSEGSNYGWPIVSYGIEYSGAPINKGEMSGSDFTEPVYYWDPVIAPGGIDFYTGDLIEEWLLEEEGERFRDVLVGQDGSVYTITDSGKLYQLTVE